METSRNKTCRAVVVKVHFCRAMSCIFVTFSSPARQAIRHRDTHGRRDVTRANDRQFDLMDGYRNVPEIMNGRDARQLRACIRWEIRATPTLPARSANRCTLLRYRPSPGIPPVTIPVPYGWKFSVFSPGGRAMIVNFFRYRSKCSPG